MTGIKIEKGVPLPERRGKYPWNDMEVGDSFAVDDGGDPKRTRDLLSMAAQTRKKRNPGENYTIRTLEENGKRVIRVWRLA